MRDRIYIGRFDQSDALRIFRNLDHEDMMEVIVMRGEPYDPLGQLVEWSLAAQVSISSHVASIQRGGRLVPFAVMNLARTGHPAVAEAAFLSCSHRAFAWPLRRLALQIRDELPGLAERQGLTRIEARCAMHHPTAERLLSALGFRREAELPGYRRETCLQYAWTAQATPSSEEN